MRILLRDPSVGASVVCMFSFLVQYIIVIA